MRLLRHCVLCSLPATAILAGTAAWKVSAQAGRPNTWKTIGSTVNVRRRPAATTGPDGRVYAMGGAGAGQGRLLEVLPTT